jgi:pimeloyl-ACP methyl ester carboxylesterase
MQMPHAVLAELRIRKAILVGLMGGYVALAFAELYPEYLGLVLLNSTARADSEERKLNRSCD